MNNLIINGDECSFTISNAGLEDTVKINLADLELIKTYTGWRTHTVKYKDRTYKYAATYITENGKRKVIFLTKLLTGSKVKWADGNTLNCTRSNLVIHDIK